MPTLTLYFGPLFADYNWADTSHKLDCPGWHQQGAEWILGRAPTSDLTINVRNVSRRHAAISYSYAADRWSVQDLGSSEGTFLNGQKLKPGDLHPLVIGDRLYLGPNLVNVVEDEDDTISDHGPPTLASTTPITTWPPEPAAAPPPAPAPAPPPAPPPARSWADSLYFFLEWTVTAQTRAGKLYRLTVASVLVGLGVVVLHYLTQ